MRRRAKILGWAFGVCLAGGAQGQLALPELVANLNQTPADVTYTAYDYAELDHTTLLLTTDRFDHGLWASDGTVAGTRQLADLCFTFFSCGAAPTFIGSDAERAFFIAHDGSGDPQLWVSDGTLLGTLVLTTFTFWPSQDFVEEVWDAPRGRLYFRATTPVLGVEPWVSDGTVTGTRVLADLAPGSTSSSPFAFVAAPVGAFVFTRPTASTEELWVSDGRPGGSQRLAESGIRDLKPLGVASGRLVFLRRTAEHGFEPWVSDGTLAGTRLLKDTVPGSTAKGDGSQSHTANLGSLLLWSGAAPGSGGAVWRTDGTPGGTFALPASPDSSTFDPGTWFAGSSRLWWGQGRSGDGSEVWVTDGTVAGTHFVLDACEQGCVGTFGPKALLGEDALLPQQDPVRGQELWLSDGTAAGTVLVKDICRGSCSANIREVLPWNNQAVFAATDDQGLTQLWKTDGTSTGTEVIAPLPDTGFGPVIVERGAVAPNGDFLLSFATDAASGLFAAETAGGLQHLSSLGRRNDSGSSLSYLEVVGGRLLYQARLADDQADLFALAPGGTPQRLRPVGFPEESLYGISATKVGERVFMANNFERLYVTDSTPAGTRRISLASTSLCGLVPFGGEEVLLFLEAGFDRDLDLWASDGTAAGTRLVSRGVGPRRCDFVPSRAELAGAAFFIGSGGDLWRTDGTEAGTLRVFDFDFRPNSFSYGEIAVGSGRVWFVAGKGEQVGLWTSDGTTAGTRFVSPLLEGLDSYYEFTPIGDRVVFSAFTREHGYELWASDGTAAGTGMVRDLRPGPQSSESYGLIASGGKVYFNANEGLYGEELWVTDGTAEGTRQVIDLRPGAASGRSLIKFPFRGGLLLSASDGEHGGELFLTDGTRQGTRLVADLAPGAASSLPAWMAVDGDTLYFSADDGRLGDEIWKVTIPPELPPCTSPQDLCLHNGRIRVRVGWRDPRSGNSGVGTALPFSTQSGYFWFFNPANVELVVKVLDGGPVNGHWWSFYGALSDVEYWVEVTDLTTGRTESYRNPPRNICGVGDTTSLPKSVSQEGATLRLSAAAGQPEPRAATGQCSPAAGTLCLLDGRFAVSVDWRNFRTGETGVGTALPGTDQSGSFWFFNPGNLELVVKMLDGTAANGHFWFFYGALSDVEYTVTVTDTVSGEEKTYANPARNICGRGDTTAFSLP